MRTPLLALAALFLSLALGSDALGQADPNQNPGASLRQQLIDNMNNAGVTPRDILQQAGQQMQDGTFNIQDFTQQLQQQGVINQGMLDQFNQMRNQAQNQGGFQGRNQQRQMSNLQQLLNATDDEWAVLGPRIQRVLDLSNDFNQAANNPPSQFRNQGAPQQQPTPTAPVAAALADLRNLLQDPNSPDSSVREKLTAYRQARAKVAADLAGARIDLLNVLTLRQESILLTMLIVE
jgi:hypothetical protein